MKQIILLISFIFFATCIYASDNAKDSIPSWAEPYLTQHQKDFLTELTSKYASISWSALQDIISDKDLRDKYLNSLEEDYKSGELKTDKSQSLMTLQVKHRFKPLATYDDCKYATLIIYKPYTRDDLNVWLDIAYKKSGNDIMLLSYSIRFNGMCAPGATFTQFDDKAVQLQEFGDHLDGVLYGMLSFKDSKLDLIEIKVLRSFRIEKADL